MQAEHVNRSFYQLCFFREPPDYCRHTIVVCSTYVGKTKVLRSWCVCARVCVCVLFPPVMTDLIMLPFNVYTNNCYHPPPKNFKELLCTCMGVPVCVEAGGQLCGVSSLSLCWVLGIKLRSSALRSKCIPTLCTLVRLSLLRVCSWCFLCFVHCSQHLSCIQWVLRIKCDQANQMFCNLTSRALENTLRPSRMFSCLYPLPFPLSFNPAFPLSCLQEQ